MRYFVTNLLIAAMIAMPFHAWGALMQCGCDSLSVGEGVVEVVDSCCAPPAATDTDTDQDPGQNRGPCDEQGCPSDCCDLSVGSIFMLHARPKLVTEPLQIQHVSWDALDVCPSPHLLRLKRPPRSV